MLERKDLSKMADIRRVEFAGYFKALSLHGWSNVFSASARGRKFIWLLLCCTSLGLFIEFANRIISSYHRRETYLATKVTPVDSLRLPAITFCNSNLPINDSAIRTNASIPVAQKLPPTCSNYSSDDFVNVINQRFFDNGCKTFMALARNATIGYGHYKLDLKFPGNFSFTPNYWPCFTLNKDGHIIQTASGERRGLKIMLYFNSTDVEDIGVKIRNWHIIDFRSGMYVDIHDQQYNIRRFEGISLSPGFHVVIKLKKITSKRLKSPFESNCYDDSDNPSTKAINGKYSIENCIMNCELDIVYAKCGSLRNLAGPFVDISLYPERSNKTNDEFNDCVVHAMKSANQANCNCQLPCEQINYETQTTYRTWPQAWEVQRLIPILSDVTGISSKDINLDLMRKHLMQVSIYYSDLFETRISEEVAYGIEKAVSDFGGQMGMFLGASFLSLFEILFVIYDIVKLRFKRNLSLRDEQINEPDNNGSHKNI